MPTKFTSVVGGMMHIQHLRKQCLHCLEIEEGISWEYMRVLEYIKRSPGCKQNDISKKLHVTAAAVTQSTQKLEAMGLMEKKIDSSNLRVKLMYITEKGERILDRGTELFDMLDGVMFEGISDEELNQLNVLFDKICKNMIKYRDNKNSDNN